MKRANSNLMVSTGYFTGRIDSHCNRQTCISEGLCLLHTTLRTGREVAEMAVPAAGKSHSPYRRQRCCTSYPQMQGCPRTIPRTDRQEMEDSFGPERKTVVPAAGKSHSPYRRQRCCTSYPQMQGCPRTIPRTDRQEMEDSFGPERETMGQEMEDSFGPERETVVPAAGKSHSPYRRQRCCTSYPQMQGCPRTIPRTDRQEMEEMLAALPQ